MRKYWTGQEGSILINCADREAYEACFKARYEPKRHLQLVMALAALHLLLPWQITLIRVQDPKARDDHPDAYPEASGIFGPLL